MEKMKSGETEEVRSGKYEVGSERPILVLRATLYVLREQPRKVLGSKL
jgi:hypothetical protein